MSLKDAILEIPELVKQLKEKFVEKAPQKFMDAKLKDGTIVSWEGDAPAMGLPIMVVDEAGNKLPAPDGEHELEDGTVIVVSGGMIVEVKPSAEAAPAAEEGMGDDKPQGAGITASQAKTIIESVIKETVFTNQEYLNKISALEKSNSELKAELESQRSLLKETFSLVEKIADAPVVAPEKKNDGFMKKEPQGKLERLMSEAKELTNKTFKN